MTKLARLVAGLALAVAFGAASPLGAAAASSDYSVLGGWFYSQTGGGTGRGFNVLDGGLDARGQVTRFYSEFNRIGGVPALGYPASNVFTMPDGFTYQATQAALMQWHPEDAPKGGVELANVFDVFSKAGRDGDLQKRGIPAPIADDGSGGDFQKAIQVRLGWLTQPEIKAKYLANPNPESIKSWDQSLAIQLYGLPASQPLRSGPFVVQRFQRVAFQLWIDAVPGQPTPGTVVPILGGDLAKEFGLVPASSQSAQAAASQPVQIDPALQSAVTLLQRYDQQRGTSYMANLAAHNVSVRLIADKTLNPPPQTDAKALGLYSVDDNTVYISDAVQSEDIRDVADLVSHESSHALDRWTGADIVSSQGCLTTEVQAFKHQVDVWRWFYPQLKQQPLDSLDQFLNQVTRFVESNPAGFVQKLTQVYNHQCSV